MRPGSYSDSSPSDRPRGCRERSSSSQVRRARSRRAVLEWLEPRALLATVPTPVVFDPVNISSSDFSVDDNSDESSPSIAVDPNNPLRVAAVWTRWDTDPDPDFIGVEGAYSTNGGASWSSFNVSGGRLTDPASSADDPQSFDRETDASAAFDADGNLYVLSSQRTGDAGAGVLLLNKFSFTGASPVRTIDNQTVHGWAQDPVLLPTLAVDTTGGPFDGTVYVAWVSNDDTPPDTDNWNPNAIRAVASSDGGQSFSGVTTVNDGGNFGDQRNTVPRLAIGADGRPSLVWDDFGSGANAGIPFDIIEFDRLTAARVLTAELGGGPILDNATTEFTVTVPAGLTIADLDVRLVAVHDSLAELTIQLQRGATVVTLANADTLGGATMGFGTGGRQYGAVFDNQSPRSIVDAAEPYIGRFRPEGNLGAFTGDAGGDWTLRIIDTAATADAGPQNLLDAQITFTEGLRAGPDRNVNTNSGLRAAAIVRGTLDGGGTISSPAMPRGIGPAPTIAADTTADGPNRGRIYVTYVDRDAADDDDNPDDNTDIFLAYTDDGGLSWVRTGEDGDIAGRVNDDLADRDGFSGADLDLAEGFFGATSRGRPQFMPQVAVDQQTGTVAVSFYDARHDASRGRVATYLAVSVDGGETFAPQTFVNQKELVFDVATGTNRVVGPIPDNAAQGNTVGTFSFGHRQGLAALGGNIFTAWSGNLNGGPDGTIFLDIRAARAITAAGPRVVDGTAGVVPTTDPSGTPEAREFVVTFDRPIDPGTFSTDDASIRFLSPDGATSQSISATNVVQLSETEFRVEFPPQTRPGTYSYAVGPDIRDLLGNPMDQDADATPGESQQDRFGSPEPIVGGSPLTGPFVRDTLPLIVPGPRVVATRAVLGDGTTVPTTDPALNSTVVGLEVVFDRDMEGNTFSAEDVLRVVGPAGEVDRSSIVIQQLDARTFRVLFDGQQLSGTYQVVLSSNIQSVGGYLVDSNQNAGVDVLRGGQPTTTVELTFASAEVPRTIPANGSVESTLVVDKAFEITDVDLQLNISHANVPNLRAELIGPGGQTILLFSGVGATGDRTDFTNTILDSEAGQPISSGTPPFSDRYRPQESLSALNSPIGMPTEAGTYTLRITNTGGVQGALNSWRLIMRERVTGTGIGEPVADRIRADFRIFTMDPTNSLSSSTWTPVGPSSIEDGEGSGRVTAIAVDPSDPSGNTVYIGAASGGVWKTDDFLTTDAGGPTWIPLTDAVQANGLNVGGIAVFGRNNDPDQSIVMVATGEGDTGTPGVGFLRSTDGGASWELLDSADNRPAFADRTREFVGTTAFAVVADPRPTTTGEAIFYAALSGPQGGVWRSTDSGDTWQQLRAGQATDLLLDPGSGTPSLNNPAGNLQVVYAAFRGEGVYLSPNQGQQFNVMPGGIGKPRVRDGDGFDPPEIPVTNAGVNPNGIDGRIVLAKPALTGDARQDLLYQGWLYAAVANPNGTLNGLYLTKDQGQNWTQLQLPNEPTPDPSNIQYPIIPSNDTSLANYDPTSNAEFSLANYALALTVDPTNPNVVYLGGTTNGGGEAALIRVDSTFVHDAHAFYLSSDLPGGPVLRSDVNGPAVVKAGDRDDFPTGNDPRFRADEAGIFGAKINLYRDPADPFDASSTVYVNNTESFANTGAGVRWTPFAKAGGPFAPALDLAIGEQTNLHQAFSLIDPLTGRGRLILGVDKGVYTGVDAGDGTLLTRLGQGNTVVPTGSRNGNLQISQIYFGAVQPSAAAADVAGALFYAQTDGNGSPRSSSDVLQTGQLGWGSPRLATETGSLGGAGVATDPTGSGASYQYNWRNTGDAPKTPFLAGEDFRTDFFLVDVTPGNGNPHDVVGRIDGLAPLAQWPGIGGANFAVNPINADQIVMSAPGSGRVFRTLDRGLSWLEVGVPAALGSSYFPALAFGAPEPGAQPGNVGDYIVGGNNAGGIYITLTGGGAAGNQWTQINNGALAGNTSPVRAIATNPIRGTFEAYALTDGGLYHIADTRPSSGATWTDITANLFSITHQIFGDEDATAPLLAANGLRSLAVDWRYAIPDDFDNPPANPTNPAATHPVLYVAGVGGVFASYDDGADPENSWQRFPSAFPNSIATTPQPPGEGGGLPVVEVSDLDLSLGNINRATGLPLNQAGDPNLLMASTFGRGAFAIRLAPVVFPDSLRLVVDGESLPANPSQPPEIQPTEVVLEGFSQQSAAGNSVGIQAFLLDEDDQVIGELPIVGGTATTDSAGRFSIRIEPDSLGADGLKRIGIQAIDQAGVEGNIALYEVVIDSVPPDAPTLLDLQAGSDSGFSDADDYTNALVPPGLAAPTFDVVGVEQGVTIQLLRNNVVVATLAEAPGGVVAITDDDGGAGVPDGTYTYVTRLVDRAGNVSEDSPELVVTIDTAAPQAPTTPVLVPADDSGVPDDGVTNVRQPRLTGTLTLGANEGTPENLPLVQLSVAGIGVVGEARVDADGTYDIQVTTPLADGVYVVQARALDRAGNASGVLPGLVLRIDTSLPPGVTVGLSPTDDTGQVGDNITSVRRPRLVGSTGAGLRVELIDVGGTIPNSSPGAVVGDPVTSQANGAFTLQFPFNLPDGTYTVLARVTNAAGNILDSTPLVLTILTEVEPGAPTLRLAPESDTGLAGDGRTTERRPFLIGESTPDTRVEIVGPDGSVLASGTTDSQGSYRLRLASNLANGTIVLRARTVSVSGVPGPLGAPLTLTIETITGDRDRDGRADLILYRPGSADGESQFFIGGSTGAGQVLGSDDFRSSLPGSPLADAQLRPGDIPISGDFDGDGITDLGVFRPSSDRMPGASEWIILRSQAGPQSVLFGGSGLDVPAVGDFDGDGRDDIAVFRPVSDLLPGAAEWFILPSNSGQAFRVAFGAAGGLDLPAVADYDGDGRADIAAFRPSSDLVPGAAQWFVLPSGPNDLSFSQKLDAYPVLFGEAGVDQPVPQDYDGDGHADIATYRPTTSEWFILRSGLPFEQAGLRVEFGAPGDIPAPADYDGDAVADLAAFRPSSGRWTVRQTTDGQDVATDFGTAGDVPVLAPLAYRDPRSDSIASTGSRSVGQARQVASPAPTTPKASTTSLDLGRQAARLSSGSASSRVRPSQDQARPGGGARASSNLGSDVRSLLISWLARRRDGQPRG
ncbi:Ig-like domain-containing protein [Tautonia plasticadhaerens]|uniref:FG-GAP repeat protein n=1 Tax=Tautonia plasticadhaerens TaxID=2527974 RepID=A0A518HFH5_9BACT|nr:Ig-like domain-containing protein [Tautonia plasticadhaerens]QDV39602.1 FG-GAP repeat protein [Tautonia plasticadhaerens]